MDETPEAQEPKKRRRWWPYFAGLAIVLLAAAAMLKVTTRSEFEFLGRLGPTQVVDPGPLKRRPPSMPEYRYEAFFYDKASAPRVLEAMRRELTTAKGYKESKVLIGRLHYYSFLRGVAPNLYGAVYTDIDMFLDATLWVKKDIPKLAPGSFMVVVARGPTWFEQEWGDVKKFLHLE